MAEYAGLPESFQMITTTESSMKSAAPLVVQKYLSAAPRDPSFPLAIRNWEKSVISSQKIMNQRRLLTVRAKNIESIKRG